LFLELLLPLMLFCMSHLHFPGLLVLLSLQILQLQLLLLLEQRQAETLELGHTCNFRVLPEQKIWSYKTTVRLHGQTSGSILSKTHKQTI
jgi:hypothetical protein